MIVPLAIRRLDHAPHHPGHATTPRKHLASVARGYLAPVGGIVLATFLGQIVTTLGYGAYFPWAVPALYAGIAGVRTRPGPAGYLLVVLVGLAAVLGSRSPVAARRPDAVTAGPRAGW